MWNEVENETEIAYHINLNIESCSNEWTAYV